MNTKISKAPKASKASNHILKTSFHYCRTTIVVILLLGLLISCSSTPEVNTPPQQPASTTAPYPSPGTTRPTTLSRWVASDWSELPGWEEDVLDQVWGAWEQSCTQTSHIWQDFCAALPLQVVATKTEKRSWLQDQLQVYRIESKAGESHGVLTSYYEPLYPASRYPNARFTFPLYSPPETLTRPWYTRQAIDTLPEAQEALRGRDWAYLDSPIAVLNLHIQGSGKLLLNEPDGQVKTVRAAFAATNGQPFQSPLRWLVRQGLASSASWEAAQHWAEVNPQHVPEMLWQNPRYVFFQEKPVSAADQHLGPVGAQGVPLSAGRSVAVDPRSIPYATPLWLVSDGAGASLQRLVLAQDTGSAIVGAVRADYFAGSGFEAENLARRIHQPLRLWALWPKNQALP